MNVLSRTLAALHLAKLHAWFHECSRVIVTFSGGKDSTLALLYAIEIFGPEKIITHYQALPEAQPGTEEHCRLICTMLGIPLYISQMRYYGMVCGQCGNRHITANPAACWCHRCKDRSRQVCERLLVGIHDLIEWRQLYPDLFSRFCTAYGKRDVFNTWCRTHNELIGEAPIVVSGERWAESPGRGKLPMYSFRASLREKSEFMLEYRPILALSRRDVFCQLRDAGLPLHPCYHALWREMLCIEHEDWRAGDPQKNHPHVSYEDQWDGLRELEVLPPELLENMITRLMYEVNEEGHAPRCSCADCVFFSRLLHRASFRLRINQEIYTDALRIAHAIPHKITAKASLPQMLDLPPETGAEALLSANSCAYP